MNAVDGGPDDTPSAPLDADEPKDQQEGTETDEASAAHHGDATDPTAELPDDSEVPADLRVTFWTLVFVVKFAIMATALGGLFVVFRGDNQLGGGLVVLGAVLFLFAVVRYRRYRASTDESAGSDVAG